MLKSKYLKLHLCKLFIVLFLGPSLQGCGQFKFSATNHNMIGAVPEFDGDRPETSDATGDHGSTIVLPPGYVSPAPIQTSAICSFSEVEKTLWENLTPNLAANLPNYNISGQSGDIRISAANQVSIIGNSGNSFIVYNAETITSFSGNSGNFVGNARSFINGAGNSGSIDLNAVDVGNISGSSAGHLCIWAQNVNSVTGSSAGNISVVANGPGGAVGNLAQITGSSSGKLVIVNMNVSSILGGSGNMYIQGGHVQKISGQSGDIYLDGLVVDKIIGSSGKIYLINGAKVLN